MAYMESGDTDGMYFRRAGIPTWALSGIFMNPDEQYAHGLNERVPFKAFYDALEHYYQRSDQRLSVLTVAV